jgi:hypothetical protein
MKNEGSQSLLNAEGLPMGTLPGNHQDDDKFSVLSNSFLDDHPSLRSSFFDPPVEDYNPQLLLNNPGVLRISTQIDKKKKKRMSKKDQNAAGDEAKYHNLPPGYHHPHHSNNLMNYNVQHNSTFISGNGKTGGAHTTVDILAEDDLVD